MLALGRDADIARLRPEDWLANLIIAGTVDEEAKKELMKIDNPDMEKVRKAANTHEKQQNSLKSTASTSKAFQIKTNSNGNSNKPITCYACGETDHKSIECKRNKESLKCTKCKRTGHLAKICRSKADSGATTRRSDKARTAQPGKRKRTRMTPQSTRPGHSDPKPVPQIYCSD